MCCPAGSRWAQRRQAGRHTTCAALQGTPRLALPWSWTLGGKRKPACDTMMTMTMPSPQCRNHGLSGAGSHLPLGRQPLSGLASKQAHQSGCSACLFRHAFMNEGLAALHAQSQSFSPSRKPNRARGKKRTRSHRIRTKTCRAAVVTSLCGPSAVCRHTPGRRHCPPVARHLLHHGSFHDPR